MFFSKPKEFNDLDDCVKASKFYLRMAVVFFLELVIFIALAVAAYTSTGSFWDSWAPILFAALAVIAAMGFTGNGIACFPLGMWRRHLLKNKNIEKELAVVIEYEANLLGLEPVNKIEFKVKDSAG